MAWQFHKFISMSKKDINVLTMQAFVDEFDKGQPAHLNRYVKCINMKWYDIMLYNRCFKSIETR